MTKRDFDRRLFLKSSAAFAGLLSLTQRAGAATRRRKMLLVATNVSKVGDSVSGTFLMEIALPFRYFTDVGLEVDIVTPKGGKAAVYHAGEEGELLDQIETSPAFIAKTGDSLVPDRVRSDDYLGIFYPGGHGQFWDVVGDTKIGAVAAELHERGAVVGAAGHGMASLTNVRLSDGRYFVEGKRMTAFPWWAEKKYMTVSKFGALLPFDMEVVLRERGATVIVPTEAQRGQRDLTLIVDEQSRLVTGTWATLAQPVAQEMRRFALGDAAREPSSRAS